MSDNVQILLGNVYKHIENACKELMLSDEPLTRRVETASVELELLHPDDMDALPAELRADVKNLIRLAGAEVTQDIAVEYGSSLLGVFERVSLLCARCAK